MSHSAALHERIRRTAYFLWEHDGRPHGRSLEYWLRAEEKHLRELAYDQWLAEGTPIGRADEHWREAKGQQGGEG
jgi:hypothetical protein